MSIKDCTRIEDLFILENQRELEQPRTVAHYTGLVRYLPRYTSGCAECDRMPFGTACDSCDLASTQHEASVYGQGA